MEKVLRYLEKFLCASGVQHVEHGTSKEIELRISAGKKKIYGQEFDVLSLVVDGEKVMIIVTKE